MNNNWLIYIIAISLPFVISFISIPLIKWLAFIFKVIDDPKIASRKIHDRPIPLLGGWSLFIAVFLSLFIFRYYGWGNFSLISDFFILGIFLSSLIIMIGGTLDDKYNLKPIQQIIFPVLAVLIALIFGLRINYITNPLEIGGVIHFNIVYGTIIAGLWLLGMIYTTKFLDGLDGLVAGISVIASFFIFLISLRWDINFSATGLWALILLGASLGFLVFNYQPAQIFLGEGGSVFIGFILGVLSIISGSKIITTLLVMGLPILDVVWVIISRLISGQSPFLGDRRHLHYRLLDFGFSRSQVVWLMWLLAIIFGAFGIFSSSYGKLILVIALIFLMLLISYIFNKNNSKKNA